MPQPTGLNWADGAQAVAIGLASTRLSPSGLTGLPELSDLVLGILKAAGPPQVETGAGDPL